MFDMSWGEVMVIGTVALVVIGPKELPKALRTLGSATAKLQRMASEFQTQFNDAMREAELDDVRREVEGINRSVSGMTSGFNPVQTIRDELKGAIDKPVTSTEGSASATVGQEPLAAEVGTSHAPEPDVSLPPVPPVSEPALSAVLASEPPVPVNDVTAPPEKPESARR
jgi:sec-independent protein translocase protein TatB